MQTSQLFMLIASANGFLAVTLGAFGSHGLKAKLSEQMLGVWQTAVQYHFYHAIALMLVAVFAQRSNSAWLHGSGWAYSIGLVLFCGSLYWLALGGPSWLGPITPLGGLSFMIAWLCLGLSALQKH